MTAHSIPDAPLPAKLAALVPPDAPPLASVGWIAEMVGITPQAVLYSVRAGRLAALPIPGTKGSVSYAVRPVDAIRLWGSRMLRERASDAS